MTLDPRFIECADRLSKHVEQHPKGKRSSYLNHIDLLKAYFEVKTVVKRIPHVEDMRTHGKYSLNSYRNHFGSYREFLLVIGEEAEWMAQLIAAKRLPPTLKRSVRNPDPLPPPQRSLLEFMLEIQRHQQQLGRPLTREEIMLTAQHQFNSVLDQIIDLDKFVQGINGRTGGSTREAEVMQRGTNND
jgi:hypothetical protein